MRMKRLAACGWATFLVASGTFAAEPIAPLADAAENSNQAAVRVLLEQRADVNAAQIDGMTALHWAVYRDNLPTARLIVKAGANVKAENRYGVTSLSLACTNGNTAIVQLLLESGADPNTTLRGGETVLMTAARTGKLGPVKALLARGADVNAKERKQQTALMWAAAEGHLSVVNALIGAGADFRTPLKSGFSPFFFAVREGKTEVALRLLAEGINVSDLMGAKKPSGEARKTGTSPLILAVENGHFDLAVALLDAGADPNDHRAGFTPLHAITWVRKPVRGDGNLPPIGSGQLSSLQFVRKLVARGADVNARHKKRSAGRAALNRTDATPFLLAAVTGDPPLMRLLLELDADPSLRNVDQCTPLLAAVGVGAFGSGTQPAGTEAEALAAVKLLLKLGADINARDENGETAMHGAAYKGRTKMVHFLIDNGTDISIWNRKNKHGWTPLLIALGHRPGNFRPAPKTIVALRHVMRAAGIEPSPE